MPACSRTRDFAPSAATARSPWAPGGCESHGRAPRNTSALPGQYRTAIVGVLPFANLSGSTDEYFADGLTEDLITRLGQTPGLKVLGRSATRDYRGRAPRDVAQELGAGVVLTGSVRPAGDTVKISLELIDPDDGTDVWTGQFTRDVKDVFAVQADVAEQVAQALRVTLRPTEASVP